jgi:multidrug resistance protein, MATE family
MLLGVVDVAMVGRLGERALAGVMLGHTWTFAFQALLLGAAIGVEPLVAQAFGGRRPDRAGEALVRGAALLAVLSVPIIGLHLVADAALPLLGQPADASRVAGEYAAVRALGVPAFAGLVLLRSAMQARGQMLPGAVAIGVGNAANVLLNGWLVLGWFGMPAIGAVGAAWASVGATMVMLAVLVALSGELWRDVQPRWSAALELRPQLALLGVAIPVSLQVALESWGFSISTVLMGWMGTTALSAHAVALTLASLAFMLPLGISSAASARVGNLLGAGRPWGLPAVVAIGLGAAVMLVSGALFAAAPRPLALAFTAEEPVLALAAALLPVAGAFALFDGIQVVTFGVLRGAGDTAVPAAANVVGYYVVGLPLGAGLAFWGGLGPVGVWIGLLAALAMVSMILLVRLRSTWRRGGFRVG